jgi:hypothetical protein
MAQGIGQSLPLGSGYRSARDPASKVGDSMMVRHRAGALLLLACRPAADQAVRAWVSRG